MNWWGLPGPASLVGSINSDLRAGRSTVVHCPERLPQGLHMALSRQLRESDLFLDTIDLRDYPGQGPTDLLWSRFVGGSAPTSLRTPSELLAQGSFRGRRVWLENVCEAEWPGWRTFFVEFAHASRACSLPDRSVLCLLVQGSLSGPMPPEDVCGRVVKVSGCAEPLDIALLASHRVRRRARTDLEHRVAVAIVAGLAQWDPEVVDLLADETLDKLCSPETLLQEWGRGRGWSRIPGPMPCDAWEQGMTEEFDGENRLHSGYLAVSGRKSEVLRRVWQAQVSVLLPFVEERRSELIPLLRPHLQLPFRTRFGEVIGDAAEMEIGHLDAQIQAQRSVSGEVRNLLATLREIRNRLSHTEVVPAATLLRPELACWRGLLRRLGPRPT